MGYGVVWRMSVHALNTHRMTATRRDRVFVRYVTAAGKDQRSL